MGNTSVFCNTVNLYQVWEYSLDGAKNENLGPEAISIPVTDLSHVKMLV